MRSPTKLSLFLLAILVCIGSTFWHGSQLLQTSCVVGTEPADERSIIAARDESHISSFIAWAKNLAVDDKEILLAYATKDYTTLAYNCILSLHRVGVRNAGILTVDQDTQDFFQARSIPVYNVAKIVTGIPQDVRLNNTVVPPDIDLSRLKHPGWSNRWNTKSSVRWAHWMLRHYLALLILKEGYGVYQTDVDMVFLDNPYNWLDPQVDLEGQTQNWPHKNAVNFGIGHVAASVGGVLHWETTNNLMRYLGDDPQSLENFLLINPLFEHIGLSETKPCHSNVSIMCEWKTSPMVTIRRWPETVLPMGYQVKETNSGALEHRDMIGVHVHATVNDFQTGKAVLYEKWCREHGMWFIPSSNSSSM